MINIRSIVLITVALVVAGITAFLARSLVATPPQGEQTTIIQQVASDIQILVASNDIQTGYFLKKDDLEWQSWPGDNINKNYTQKENEQSAESQMDLFLGSVAKAPISAGEPILAGRIVKPGARGFMAAVLKPGYRAVSISINSRTGISGFIFPGDSVDLLLTHTVEENAPGNEGEPIQIQATETVLTDIRVLAIDTAMTNETNTPSIGKIATFEVLPKQAEKIALMSRMGELSLALRSLAVEDAGAAVKTANNRRSNVTYADEVSKVIAEKNGTGEGLSKKQTVKIVRANEIENLVFTVPTMNNR